MKKTLLASLLTLIVISVSSQTPSQKFYFDFGRHDTTNGEATINADINGNYWNNVGTITVNYNLPNIINSTNTSTTLALTITGANFDYNGILNGGLRTPYASQFVGNEDFAINTVTEDYFFTTLTSNGPAIEFSGLNSTKKYRFKIFGCRNSNSLRTSQYTFQGGGTAVSGTLNTSTVTGLGGTVYIDPAVSYPTNLNINYKLASETGFTQAVTFYGNNSSVYTSDYIVPDTNNKIKVSLTVVTGGFAYINAIKIEEFNNGTTDVSDKINNQLRVYPSRTSDVLHVEGEKNNVDIYSISGTKLISYKETCLSTVNVSKLSKGMYLLVVDGTETFKFTKE